MQECKRSKNHSIVTAVKDNSCLRKHFLHSLVKAASSYLSESCLGEFSLARILQPSRKERTSTAHWASSRHSPDQYRTKHEAVDCRPWRDLIQVGSRERLQPFQGFR